MTWRPVIPAGDEDATLTAVSNLVAAHKEQKLALEEARTHMNGLQDEINALKTGREDFDVLKASRDNLDTQVEMLKIGCATHVRRIEEMGRVGAEKDVRIERLEDEVRQLKEKMEQDEAGLEEYLRSRKRPRT
jgi:uncharacterized coiled-coil protein SlyX